MAELTRINAEEVKRRMDSGEAIVFIDTRNPQAWNESAVKLPGALRIHFRELKDHLSELPRDQLIVTYCT